MMGDEREAVFLEGHGATVWLAASPTLVLTPVTWTDTHTSVEKKPLQRIPVTFKTQPEPQVTVWTNKNVSKTVSIRMVLWLPLVVLWFYLAVTT